MTKIGYRTYVGLADEASFGTFVAPTDFIEYSSEEFKEEIDEILVEAINGTAQYKKRLTGNKSVSGSVEFPLVPGSALKFFKNAIGSVTTTTLTTGVYQHVLVSRINDIDKSLSFQVARDTSDTSSVLNYTGCKCNSMALNVNVNDMLIASAEFMGQNVSAANTIGTASYQTAAPFIFKNGTIKIGGTSADATTTTFESLGITINNNLIDDRVIGSNLVDVIAAGMQDVEIELTKRFDDNTLYQRFTAGTKTYISAEFTGLTISGAYVHSVKLEAFNCYFNGDVGNVGSAGDLVKSTYPIRAIYEDASVGALKVTIVSSVAT